MSRIFISYKRVDKDKVFKIKDRIESALGEKCWIDIHGIESDAVFASKIIGAINSCEVFLFMYSNAHMKITDYENDWTIRELNFAQEKKKRIVFINIDGSELSDWFKLLFGTKQQVDGISKAEVVDKLISDLSKWLNISHNEIKQEKSKRDLSHKVDIIYPLFFYIIIILFFIGSFFLRGIGYSIVSLLLSLICIGTYIYFRTHNTEILRGWKSWCIVCAFICFFSSFFLSSYLRWNNVPHNRLIIPNVEDKNDIITFTVGEEAVKFNMIKVEGGEFLMASSDSADIDGVSDEIPHKVELSTFYIGESEVTQNLWFAIMGNNPSKFAKGGEYPVENVSWDDCMQFIDKLNMYTAKQLNGKRFAFLTEAQWEYAAIGGKDGIRYKYCGSDSLSKVAWFDENSGNTTHPVKTKKPNSLGIYDMSGNVWEWCLDKYGAYTTSASINPSGSDSGTERVDRGGGWIDNFSNCRTSNRGSLTPSTRFPNLGLRLALK